MTGPIYLSVQSPFKLIAIIGTNCSFGKMFHELLRRHVLLVQINLVGSGLNGLTERSSVW